MNKDEVMQVQLLNILRVIYFDTSDFHREYYAATKNIFGYQLLNDCINIGIQVNDIYVRNHYITFIENCLGIYNMFLDEDTNLRIASRLIINISDFLFRNAFQYKNKEESLGSGVFSKFNDDQHNKLSKLTSNTYFVKNRDFESRLSIKFFFDK